MNPEIPTKFSSIVDEYNQVTLELNNGMTLEVRAYNDGLAYRFISGLKGDYQIKDEKMSLVFPVDRELFPQKKISLSPTMSAIMWKVHW